MGESLVVNEMEHMQVSKTVMARLAVVAMVVAVAVAQDEGSGVGLPAGHGDILSNPYDPESFSCEGQDYGYYADVESNCEIFHICLPIQDNDGIVTSTAKYSFFCGNGTVFDQQALVCNHADDAFPCEESPSLYGAVPFGEVLQDY